jgi:pimeloyl-ACP methyl ester carboxylesterase
MTPASATTSSFRAAPHRPVKATGPLLMALESRAPLEGLALLAAMPWLSRLPRGDGHPVMVFPGMGANDLTTLPLRRFLRRLGYVTQAWGQGLNFGPRRGVLRRCAADVKALAERHGQAVSLIGWSLGGLYAREMAKELPDHTRCVVTLGTPFAGHPKATNAWRIYELLSGQSAHDPVMHEQLRATPTVPTTSIYSRTDGIVAWQCSLNEPGPTTENIEVHGSHVGMGVNPLALYAVADRLAQPVGAWKAFEMRGLRRLLYPTPGHGEA